jgi:CRP/FNR family cyclic AMP-dependent transcriptional regulator
VQPDPARLRNVSLFSDLPDEDLQIIASWFQVEEVSEGRRMAPEGAAGYQFYVIDQGTADVTHDGASIASLGPGDHFGEMAMVGDGRRMADVVATSPMTVFAMFGTAFREMESGYPAIAARIRATAEERLADL